MILENKTQFWMKIFAYSNFSLALSLASSSMKEGWRILPIYRYKSYGDFQNYSNIIRTFLVLEKLLRELVTSYWKVKSTLVKKVWSVSRPGKKIRHGAFGSLKMKCIEVNLLAAILCCKLLCYYTKYSVLEITNQFL